MRRELLEQTDEPWPRAGRRAKGTNWATELSQTNGQKAKHANCMCMPALQAKLTSCIMSRAASCESGSNLMANSTFRKWLGSRADSTRRPPLDQPCQRAVPTSRTCERSPQAHTHIQAHVSCLPVAPGFCIRPTMRAGPLKRAAAPNRQTGINTGSNQEPSQRIASTSWVQDVGHEHN